MTAPKYRTSMDADAAFSGPRLVPEENLDALPMFAPPAPVKDAAPDRTGEEETKARALAHHEAAHAGLLERMRAHALSVYRRTGRPVSANDVRALLDDELRAGRAVDRRVLGQVFAGKQWQRVGTVDTNAEGATASRVGVARSGIGSYVWVGDDA